LLLLMAERMVVHPRHILERSMRSVATALPAAFKIIASAAKRESRRCHWNLPYDHISGPPIRNGLLKENAIVRVAQWNRLRPSLYIYNVVWVSVAMYLYSFSLF
jgi:hypothetical protein